MSRDCAVFTIVKNEDFFLPLWLNHYSRFFAPEDIFVLNHDSTGQSACQIQSIIDLRAATVINVHWDMVFSHDWLGLTVNRFHAFLRQSYSKILFTEIDELVTVRNGSSYKDLRDYIARFQGPIARTTGYNVVHFPAIGELPIDPSQPLLEQRNYWYQPSGVWPDNGKWMDWYNKPLLTSVPVVYQAGFHILLSHEDVLADPDLILVHLHEIDINVTQWRRRGKDMSRLDPSNKPDFHNKPMLEETLQYFLTRLPDDTFQRIPDNQKQIV